MPVALGTRELRGARLLSRGGRVAVALVSGRLPPTRLGERQRRDRLSRGSAIVVPGHVKGPSARTVRSGIAAGHHCLVDLFETSI